MKLSVVIPVYNEKNTIKDIVSQVKNVAGLEKELILVDDGSKDGTRDILKQMESEMPDLKIIYKDENKGKGHSLKLGFQASSGDYVIVQDADLEYDPNDYIKLVEALNEDHVDVVYGSRFSGNYSNMYNLHFIGNKLLTLITVMLYGVYLTDMETCYKLMPGDFARKVNIVSDRFDFEPEITAKIIKAGLKIKEVPIKYTGRKFSEGKKITWKDGISAIKALFKFRFFS